MAKHKCKQADAVEWFMRKELELREAKAEPKAEPEAKPKEKEKTKKS